MAQITTEITSSQIVSDNPIHQRLLYAYEAALPYIHGNVLELGCGEGRGLEKLSPRCSHYTALDKNQYLLDILSKKYPQFTFINRTIPPLNGLADNSYDVVIAFQVIEHIANDGLFVREIARVLKPGGTLILTTPNKALTLTRNPWHEREYTYATLTKLLAPHFNNVEAQGVSGSEAVWDYYEMNKESVRKYTRWDIFNMQYWLPSSILRIPYDYLNRKNRNKMLAGNQGLVTQITETDFFLTTQPEQSLDLFFIMRK